MWEEVLLRWLSSQAMFLDQAPEVPLQCLRLPQLGVVNPRVNHNSCNALIILQDCGYLRRNIKNTSTRKQWVCTLPSANVARTCRTIESPMITASCSISQRGAKWLWEEISKTGGGEVVDRGLDRVFCCCTQGPGFPGAGVKDIWEDRVPGAEKHTV